MGKMYPEIKTSFKRTTFHSLWYTGIVTMIHRRLLPLNTFDIIEKLFPEERSIKSFSNEGGYHEFNSDKMNTKRNFIKWFLAYMYIIRKDKEKVELLDQEMKHAFSGDENWDFSLGNLLDPQNIAMMKNVICNNWNIINCTSITENAIDDAFQSCKNDARCLQANSASTTTKEVMWILKFWAFDKYWRSDKILESIIHKGFNEEEEDEEAKRTLYRYPTNYKDNLHIYYLWHFMQGQRLSDLDQLTLVIKDRLDLELRATFVDYGLNDQSILDVLNIQAIKCLEGSDFKSEACKIVDQFIENQFYQIYQTSIKQLETWMDQPKIHGDAYEDYILVPLCSIAEDRLSQCYLFQPSKLVAQDRKCFTYDPKDHHANVGPTHGFNFLLNLQNIPHDKTDQPLSVDLYLHESGTYPDIFSVKTFPTRLLATEQVIKIGVRKTSRKVTQNFESMALEKRKCNLSKEKKYSRVNCVVDSIHDKAMETCGCFPRSMKIQTIPICDLNGAMCFRNVSEMMKDNFNHSQCLLECNEIYYDANKRVEAYVDFLTHGQEYNDFLWTNPIGNMLNDNVSEFNWLAEKNVKLKDTAKRYSLVHVYFEHPMKNVITQDAKITLTGMVSSIGGTLGIFLGLSMITLFDECFQIFKYIRDFFRRKKSLPI